MHLKLLILPAVVSLVLAGCGGGGGSDSGQSGSTTTTTTPFIGTIAFSPTVVQVGQSVTVTWNAGDVPSGCTVSATTAAGASLWSGSRPASGSESLLMTTAGFVGFSIQCLNTSPDHTGLLNAGGFAAFVTPASRFAVSGTINGLIGNLTLGLAGAAISSTTVTGFGTGTVGLFYVFDQATLANGSSYSVTVISKPAGQACTVANGSGTITGAQITNVVVTCSNAVVGSAVGGTGTGMLRDATTRARLTTSGASGRAFGAAAEIGVDRAVVATPPSWLRGTCSAGRAIAAATGTSETSVVVTCANSAGDMAYVANAGSNNISAYSINSNTGALTEIAGSPFAAGQCPFGLAVDLSGRFLYSANSCSNNISAYAIDTLTGALTPLAGSPFASHSSPESIAIDDSGSYLYASNYGSGYVTAFAINYLTGVLTSTIAYPVLGESWNSVEWDN